MEERFTYTTPESVGVSSAAVLELLKTFDGRRMHTHSVIMARGDRIFAECYYKPFHEKFLHRMYSVSKSFIAIAVGLAVTEGLMRLDDAVIGYLPEFRNENIDEFYEKCTVRDMLMMRSNIGTGVYWWGKFDSRIAAYYSQSSDKRPGGLFRYDSIGSFLLGCIIEKLTGKNFLEYLKEKALLALGFSRESYVLREPGGYAIGDSGVMCTARDLLIFARFIMRGGEWGGKQYIDRTFMEDAVKKLSHTDLSGTHGLYSSGGYGYLIWKTHPDGFSLVGMGDQLAVCDMKRDICFILTADNQAERCERHIIFYELYNHFFPRACDTPLAENAAAHRELCDYLGSRTLVAQYGERSAPIASSVLNRRFVKVKGELDFSAFTLGEDFITLERGEEKYTLAFSLLENRETEFSLGTRAKADMMGIYEVGKYNVNASAGWVDESTFAILAQVTDTYFGTLAVHIAFAADGATLLVRRSGQYVFDGIDGFLIARKES